MGIFGLLLKCGTKNEEDAEFCSKCGANLVTPPTGRHERRRAEEECFGLPHGGAIIGAVIGIIIILAGITQVPGIRKVHDSIEPSEYIGPIAAILFGALILAGSLYRYSRRY